MLEDASLSIEGTDLNIYKGKSKIPASIHYIPGTNFEIELINSPDDLAIFRSRIDSGFAPKRIFIANDNSEIQRRIDLSQERKRWEGIKCIVSLIA